mgnify:CR=1 FL=1
MLDESITNEKELAEAIVRDNWEACSDVVDDPHPFSAWKGKDPIAARKVYQQFIDDVSDHKHSDAAVLEAIAKALERVLVLDLNEKKERNQLRTALGLTLPRMKPIDRALKMTIWRSVDSLMISHHFAEDGWEDKKTGNGNMRFPRTRCRASELVIDAMVSLGIVKEDEYTIPSIEAIYKRYLLDL